MRIKKLLSKLRIKKISTFILLGALFISVVPVLIMGILSYNISNYVSLEQNIQTVEYNLETLNINLNAAFGVIRDMARGIVSDRKASENEETIIEILSSDSNGTGVFYQYNRMSVVESRLNNLLGENSNIIHMYLSNGKGFTYSSALYMDNRHFLINVADDEEIKEELWYESMLSNNGKELFFGGNILESYTVNNEGYDTFSCAKLLVDAVTFKPAGYIVMNIDKSILANTFPKGIELENSTYLIVDSSYGSEPVIVFQTNEFENVGEIVDEYYSGGYDGQGRFLIMNVKNDISGWDLLYILDVKAAGRSFSLIGVSSAVMVVVLIVLIVIMNFIFIGRVKKPLQKLEMDISNLASGKTLTIEETFAYDDIGLIGNEFKKMAAQNLTLRESIYQSAIKQKDAEFKVLQAQINPHFLYNTLDTMYWLSSLKGDKDVAQLALSLSQIFKLTLNRGNDFATVRNEIKHIENYLIILKIRYGEKIETEIDVDEELMGFRILKLILQPIVENAICHGLEPKKENGRLSITGRVSEDIMEFIVADDGVGFEMNELDSIIHGGYAINNVQKRIELYYGKGFGLSFESAPLRGTTVTVRIPVDVKYTGG